MKRLVVFLLLLVVLVSCFPGIMSYAASEESLTLTEEIESNISGFDTSSYNSTRNEILGAVVVKSESNTCLYIYFYNADFDYILGGYLNLSISSYNGDTEVYDKFYSSIACSIVDESEGFCKLKVNLSSISSKLFQSGVDRVIASWNKLSLTHSDVSYEDSLYGTTEKIIYQNNSYTVTFNSDGTSDVSFEQSEVAEFEVEYTSYKTSATDGWNIRDEIHTVYFSIPKEYIDFYPDLYSVSSTYTRKKTTPILIRAIPYGPQPDGTASLLERDEFYRKLNNYISSDYFSRNNMTNVTLHSSFLSPGFPDLDGVIHINDKDLPEEFAYYFETYDSEEFYVPVESLFEYIKKYEGSRPNFFQESQKFAYSTKTIDMSWTSIPYVENASFSEISNKYGFWAAVKLWWYKDSPEKIQEIAKNYAIDVNYDELLSTPQPYLFLIDESEEKKIAGYTDEYVSKTYLININDVSSFREYLKTHDNVIIYRFDITDHSSSKLNSYYDMDSDTPNFAFVEQYLYFDFQVIDVTFKRDGTYHSLNVTSEKMDVGGDVEVPKDDPPIEIHPTLPGDPDEVPEGINWLQIVLIVVSVVMIGAAFTWLVRILADIAKIRESKRKQ